MYRLDCDTYFSSNEQSIAIEPRLPQYAYPEHTHCFDEIVVINSGRGTHILNGRPYLLHPGMICYIKADDHHLYENVDNLNLTNILYRSSHGFHFLRDISPLLPDSSVDTSSHWCIAKKNNHRIQSLLTELTGINTSTAYKESIFLQLLTILYHERYNDKGLGTNEDKANQLLRWLQFNFASDISWNELAEKFDLPLRSLHRHIKMTTGCTPQRYLTKLRLSEAYYQLCYSNLSITEIAYNCGFNDSAYFSTTFRFEFNITPKELRHCCSK